MTKQVKSYRSGKEFGGAAHDMVQHGFEEEHEIPVPNEMVGWVVTFVTLLVVFSALVLWKGF